MVCWSAQKSTGRLWFSSMPRVVDVGWSHCLLSFLCHFDCLYFQFTWIEWVLLIHQFIFLFVLSLPFVNLQLFHRYLMWVGVFFFGRCSHWYIWVTGEWGLYALHHGIKKKINGSHFGLPPSSMHRMTGLGGNFVWTMMYLHRPHSILVSIKREIV